MGIIVGIDVGGTFTDVVALNTADGRAFFHKLPSTRENPSIAALQGLREVLEISGASTDELTGVSHGTTVATNAVLESRYAETALVTTKGFRDVLELGRQRRPDLWDLDKDKPDSIARRGSRFEIDERLNNRGEVLKTPDADAIRHVVNEVAETGAKAVAVCLMHSYANNSHEQLIKDELTANLPGVYICSSTEVINEFREYERFCSTVLNASLLPVMDKYLGDFEDGVQSCSDGAYLRVMQSSGGTMSALSARRKPINTFLSGPAAGVVGSVAIAAAADSENFITLDVGGTSADVCLVAEGASTLRLNQLIGGLPVKTPTVDVHTVGAGGGSIAWVDTSGLLKVGPESAGAYPGPACYGRGGTRATVSDANQMLGRLNPEYLLGGRLKVDRPAAERVIRELAQRLNISETEASSGILKIANAHMVQAIRVISVECGQDPRDFALLAGGGGGPIQAAEVARELGIRKVIVPGHPGLLCALGLLHSRLRADFSRTRLIKVADGSEQAIETLRNEVLAEVDAWRTEEGLQEEVLNLRAIGDFRYAGQDSELQVELGLDALQGDAAATLRKAFHEAHEENYGYAAENQSVELVAVRVAVIGDKPEGPMPAPAEGGSGQPLTQREVWFEETGWVSTPIYDRDQLRVNEKLSGPAVIEQMDSSTLVLPGMSFCVLPTGVLVLEEEN